MPIYRKIAMAGATAAVIVGAGTAALAVSGASTSTNGSGSSNSSHAWSPGRHHGWGRMHHGMLRHQMLRRALHGSIVTGGKNGYVVHSGIRGTASSVSATSITVKAADGFTQTFTVAKTTRVRVLAMNQRPRRQSSNISDVKSGDTVAVLGKAPESSHGDPTASIVLDLKK
jgi:preprotein translocase subunit YajC